MGLPEFWGQWLFWVVFPPPEVRAPPGLPSTRCTSHNRGKTPRSGVGAPRGNTWPSCFLDYLEIQRAKDVERAAETGADRFAEGLKECLSGDRGTIKARIARKFWVCLMCGGRILPGGGCWRLNFTVDAFTRKGFVWETAAVCDPCVTEWAEHQVDDLVGGQHAVK